MKSFGQLKIGDTIYSEIVNTDNREEIELTVDDIYSITGITDNDTVMIKFDKNIPDTDRNDLAVQSNWAVWSTIPINGKYTIVRTFKI